jgi:hypothetical protein
LETLILTIVADVAECLLQVYTTDASRPFCAPAHGRLWPIASFIVVQHLQQIKHSGRAGNHAGVGQRIQELVAGAYRTPPELTKRLADMLK